LKELWDAGEISRDEVLADITNAKKYYTKPATRIFILQAFRELAAIKPISKKPKAERAYVAAQFATDMLQQGYTYAEIDYALNVWRLNPRDFAPHSGNIIEILDGAGYARPTKGQGVRHAERLKMLIDPNYRAPEPKPHVGIRTHTKPYRQKASLAERKAQVAARPIQPASNNNKRARELRERDERSRMIKRLQSAESTRVVPRRIGSSRVFAAQTMHGGKWVDLDLKVTEQEAKSVLEITG
jgi:hypothetical protein